VTLRWEYVGDDRSSVRYFVDDEPVGSDEAGFDRVLEIVSASDEPLTLRVLEPGLGGTNLLDDLPFAPRLDELKERLDGRPLLYQLF
jgi:hypothetical protein